MIGLMDSRCRGAGRMKLHWYTSKHSPPADKVAGGLYGYEKEPDYETIEKYDLRFIAYETWDKVTDRYF